MEEQQRTTKGQRRCSHADGTAESEAKKTYTTVEEEKVLNWAKNPILSPRICTMLLLCLSRELHTKDAHFLMELIQVIALS